MVTYSMRTGTRRQKQAPWSTGNDHVCNSKFLPTCTCPEDDCKSGAIGQVLQRNGSIQGFIHICERDGEKELDLKAELTCTKILWLRSPKMCVWVFEDPEELRVGATGQIRVQRQKMTSDLRDSQRRNCICCVQALDKLSKAHWHCKNHQSYSLYWFKG